MKQLSFCTDDVLQICSWSKSIEEFTGKPSSSVIGRKYYEILPRIIDDDNDALSLSLIHDKTLNFKEYPLNALNCSMYADINIIPLNGSGGNAKKVKVSIHPYSTCEFKKIILESQRFIDIGKMASTLAHGVRNPLNALKGAVVYLGEKYKHESTLIEFTDIMAQEISRLDNFISKFLSTSILDNETSITDINSLTKKIEIITSLQAYALKIKTIFEYGNLAPIKINSFHFEQVILNVINNAIEAMSNGGELKIKTYTRKIDKTLHAVIEVSDTGHGMPDNKIETLSLDSGNSSGRGFGLIIAHEIVKSYNGKIIIKSEKHVGTVIKLYFPY